MFGDARGYQVDILVGDLCAAISAPLLIALAVLTNESAFAVLAAFPPSLTGALIHVIHHRYAPATISFFGWAPIGPSAASLGILAFASSGNDAIGIFTFAGAAFAGAAVMTAVDFYLARDVTKHVPHDALI